MNEQAANFEPLLTKKIQTGVAYSDEGREAETLFNVSIVIALTSTLPIYFS